MKLSLLRIFKKLKKEHKKTLSTKDAADSMHQRKSNRPMEPGNFYDDLEDPKQHVRTQDNDFDMSDDEQIAQMANELVDDNEENKD